MSPITRAMLGFAADWPLKKKVETIQSFLGNDYFDANGLMYCMWRSQGDVLRPYREEDLEGQLPFKKKHISAVGHYHNENSTHTSGTFLWSQALRYKVTREPEALAFCARAFRSLDFIFKLTETAGPLGFFCKPYDGKISIESSPDQHYSAMMGLWHYRDICDKDTKARAEFMIVSMAGFWMSNDYKLAFFGHAAASWLLANTPNYGPLFALMMHLAYTISKDETFLRECRRILELCGSWPRLYDEIRLKRREGKEAWTWPKHLYGCEYDPSRREFLMADWESRAPMWFVAGPAEYFLDTDLVNRHLLGHVLGRIHRYMQFGLRDDLIHLYYQQVDLERDLWRPLICPRSEETIKADPWHWHFSTYWSEVGWQDQLFCLLDTCIIAHQHAYEFAPGALPLAQRILARLDRERLNWFVDPDGKQLLPPDQHMKHSLSSQLPNILIAYWRAKLNNIPLE